MDRPVYKHWIGFITTITVSVVLIVLQLITYATYGYEPFIVSKGIYCECLTLDKDYYLYNPISSGQKYCSACGINLEESNVVMLITKNYCSTCNKATNDVRYHTSCGTEVEHIGFIPIKDYGFKNVHEAIWLTSVMRVCLSFSVFLLAVLIGYVAELIRYKKESRDE